jgi:hypothetical protein
MLMRTPAKPHILLFSISIMMMLGGCQSLDALKSEIMDESTYTTFSGRFIDIARQRQVSDADASSITVAAETLSGKNKQTSYQLDGRSPLPAGTQELRGSGPLQDYATSILARLLAQWPYGGPATKVLVTTSSAYTAEVVPSNTILLSQGLFVNAASEDELAFILAHELSHVLLNHLDADRYHAAQKTLEDTGVGLLLKVAFDTSAQDSRNTLIAYSGYRLAQESLLNPIWTRQQEDEADLLGLDLLERAGYNSSVYQVVMQRLASDIEKQKAKAEAERQRFDREVVALVESGQIDAGLRKAFGKLAEAPSFFLKEIGSILGVGHNPPQRRWDDLDAYVRREEAYEAANRPLSVQPYEKAVFQGAGFRALARSVLAQRADGLIGEGRLAEAEALLNDAARGGFDTDSQLRLSLYRLHVKQGRPDLGVKDLEIAVRDSSAPKEAFEFLILEYANAGRPVQALSTLDHMEQRFPGREQNYPLRMKLLLESGRLQEMAMVYERCRSLKGQPVIRECQAVWNDATQGAGSRFPLTP